MSYYVIRLRKLYSRNMTFCIWLIASYSKIQKKNTYYVTNNPNTRYKIIQDTKQHQIYDYEIAPNNNNFVSQIEYSQVQALSEHKNYITETRKVYTRYGNIATAEQVRFSPWNDLCMVCLHSVLIILFLGCAHLDRRSSTIWHISTGADLERGGKIH